MSNISEDLIVEFHSTGNGDNLDSLLEIAASEGYVILPDGFAKAKGGAFELDNLLLPCDLLTWKTFAAAYNAGRSEDVFPTWFSYDASKDSFNLSEAELVAAYIRNRHLEKSAEGFFSNGERITEDQIKAALLASIAIVRAKPGDFMTSAFRHLQTVCPAKKTDQLFPAWYDMEHGKIREMLFVSYLAEKTGWRKAGRIVRTADGQIVTSDNVRQTIALEIADYCQTDTARKSNSLFRLFVSCLPEAKGQNQLDIVSARELSTEALSPPAFTVKSLLPVGLTVFAAAPKIGKSWLCLALADAITTGQKFMGFDVAAGACLYMALEDSKFRVRERLSKIGSAMPERLQIATTGARRLDDGLLVQLENWITSTPDARLIVVDTLARVKPLSASGLDAYSQDTATIAPLQALAMAHDVSILLVTHYSKARPIAADADPFDRITGSNGLFGVADAAWLIYGKRGADDMTFRTTGRDSLDNEFAISFNKETCRWQMLGTSEALEEQKKLDAYHASPLARTIIELVNAQGRWEGSATELLVEVASRHSLYVCDVKNIGAELSAIARYLLELDHIVFHKAPGGKRGRAYTFERVERFA